MKANRQRLLTTISVVVDCWDRAKTHKDFAEQVGIHIEDLRDILFQESKAWLDKRTAHVPAKIRRTPTPKADAILKASL